MIGKAGTRREIAEGSPKFVVIGGEPIVVFFVDGEYLAVRNRCPHQQFEKLHEGEVGGAAVTCPMHGWKFDLRTGRGLNKGGTLATFRTILDGNDVLVDLGNERS